MIWHLKDRRLMAPEGDPAGSGGASAPAAPPAPPAPPSGDDIQPPQDKMYTEQEVNKREALLRRSYERKAKEQQAEMEARIKKLESSTQTPPKTAAPVDQTEGGRLKLLEERFQRTEKELNDRIAESEKKYENELKLRRKMERDTALDAALISANVDGKNMVAARRYFLPQIKWDDLDSCWMFSLSGGDHLVSIDEGITAELPDIFKPSKMSRGGSGSSSGVPSGKQRKHRELEAEEKILSDLKTAAKKNPSDTSVMTSFTVQKRKVQALRTELGVSST